MYRAYWQFYKTLFPFIAAFTLACMLFGGLYWGILLFAILGPIVGMVCFKVFYNEQFYFYFNLGHTYLELLKITFVINTLVGIPIFGILILIVNFFVGGFSIT